MIVCNICNHTYYLTFIRIKYNQYFVLTTDNYFKKHCTVKIPSFKNELLFLPFKQKIIL